LTGTDPVKLGLVASFNHPGGNVTGVSFLTTATETKRLGLLHDLLPKATVIAALADPNFLTTVGQLKDLQDAARTVGQEIQVVEASTESQLDSAFATLAQLRSDAVIVVGAPFSRHGAKGSLHLLTTTECRQCIFGANSRRPAAS
jgi:putative ABC transport system substrate-binding protein